MLKYGKFRASRNISAGRILQAIHSTGRSERHFRILVKIILLLLISMLFVEITLFPSPTISGTTAFIFVHIGMWFIKGNFWVYLLDSFNWVGDLVLSTIIVYSKLLQGRSGSEGNCQAIVICGSMCRYQFHERSHLGLWIIRRTDAWQGWCSRL